jgi:dienelactone hydrolase
MTPVFPARLLHRNTVFLALIVQLATLPLMAQTNSQPWLAAAPPTPELTVPVSLSEWRSQRAGIRERLRQLLGELPPRPAQPSVRTLSREDREGYSLERFEFDNGAGATVPGYLFLPKGGGGKSPALLWCHWHGGQYDSGKEELLRSEHTPEIPGPALAKAGYAVLGIDAYCFGERNGKGPGGPDEKGGAGEMTASKFNLWMGRSLWGMILRDDLMALDYLATRPEVDAARIGVTGISMGATRSWWLMALDERLRAGVAVACLTRYQDLIAEAGLKYHGIYYFVPGMLRHFDTETVIALIAPRPILFLTGENDPGSPTAGIRKIESKAKEIYALHGQERNFESILYPDTGHVYTRDMWERMSRWMDAALKPVR